MKSIITTVCILSLFGSLIGMTIWGAATSTVSCTVTAKNISLSVTDGSVAYSTLDLNSTTTTIVLVDTQVVSNDGNVTEDINVKSSDAAGGTSWNLAAAAGSDEYLHRFSTTTGSTWVSFAVDHAYSTLETGIAVSATTSLDLYIHTPTASTDYTEKTITITAQAVEN